jgi:hypothetical protein
MRESYDFARYDFYVRHNFKLLYLQLKIQRLCSDDFQKKFKLFSITQDITFIHGKFSE